MTDEFDVLWDSHSDHMAYGPDAVRGDTGVAPTQSDASQTEWETRMEPEDTDTGGPYHGLRDMSGKMYFGEIWPTTIDGLFQGYGWKKLDSETGKVVEYFIPLTNVGLIWRNVD